MITKENITLYICEHCKKKKLFVKSAMERHEKYCADNPANFTACTGCIHIKDIEVEYSVPVDYGFVNDWEKRIAKGFYCSKLNKKLYPPKVERKGLLKKYPHTFKDQERMPTECEYYSCFEMIDCKNQFDCYLLYC